MIKMSPMVPLFTLHDKESVKLHIFIRLSLWRRGKLTVSHAAVPGSIPGIVRDLGSY